MTSTAGRRRRSSRRRHISRRRWTVAAAAAVAVAALVTVAAFAAGGTFRSIPNAGGLPDGYAPAPPPPPKPVAMFLGDSYAAGTSFGGSGYANFTSMTAFRLGMVSANAAAGATGYIQGGDQKAPYRVQFARLPEFRAPSLIVVEGSRNDTANPPAAVTAAAASLFADMKRAAPQARVVAVGPMLAWDGPLSAGDRGTAAAVKLAADRAGVAFIDPVKERWFGNAELGADKVHPSDAGHARIADRLVADLQRLGIGAAPTGR